MKYIIVRYRFLRYWFRFVSRLWLDTDIPSKHFVWLQDVFKTSSRHVFKTSSSRFQRNNFSPSNFCAEDVLKTPWRHVLKTSSRRLEDQQIFAGKFQPNLCNRCHGLLMMSINLSDITITNIKGSDYRCIISLISKNEAINLMQNADLTEKSGIL